jgi:hypothetical protein
LPGGAADEDSSSNPPSAGIKNPSLANLGTNINQNDAHTAPSSSEDDINKCDDNVQYHPDPGSRQLDNFQESSTEQQEESLGGLDLDELWGLAENVDIKMYLDFLTWIKKALLEVVLLQLWLGADY